MLREKFWDIDCYASPENDTFIIVFTDHWGNVERRVFSGQPSYLVGRKPKLLKTSFDIRW